MEEQNMQELWRAAAGEQRWLGEPQKLVDVSRAK